MLNESIRMKRIFVIFAICLTIFISNANLTSVNLALPFISKELHANLILMPWIISSYIISSGMFMILGGRVGDVFGAKRILTLSLLLWALSLCLAGGAGGMKILILARVMQGIAFAFSLPLCMVAITKVFPKERIALAVSISITVLGLSQALGPTLAGVLLQYLNWRWIFFTNLPFILLALILLFYGMAEEKNPRTNEGMDYSGAALLALGLLSLMFIFNSIQQHLMPLKFSFSLFFPVILIFLYFYFVEKKAKNPTIDFDLLFEKSFFTINIIRMLFQFLYFVLLYALPFYFLNALHISPMKTGIFLLYMTLPLACLSFFVGRIVNVISAELLIFLSFLSMLIVFSLLLSMGSSLVMYPLIISLLISGLATALVFSCSTSIALSVSPAEKRGVSSGIFFTNTLIGGAIGVCISTILMQALNQYYLSHHPVNEGSPIKIEANAFLFSFHGIMWMCLIVAFIGAVLSFFQMKYYKQTIKIERPYSHLDTEMDNAR